MVGANCQFYRIWVILVNVNGSRKTYSRWAAPASAWYTEQYISLRSSLFADCRCVVISSSYHDGRLHLDNELSKSFFPNLLY